MIMERRATARLSAYADEMYVFNFMLHANSSKIFAMAALASRRPSA